MSSSGLRAGELGGRILLHRQNERGILSGLRHRRCARQCNLTGRRLEGLPYSGRSELLAGGDPRQNRRASGGEWHPNLRHLHLQHRLCSDESGALRKGAGGSQTGGIHNRKVESLPLTYVSRVICKAIISLLI